MQAEREKTRAAMDLERALIAEGPTISITMQGIVGINHHERFTPQTITLLLHIEKSSQNISILNIRNIELFIEKIISQEKPFLIERMCYLIAGELLSNFETLMAIALTIEKPEALQHARKVYATIRMERLVKDAPQPL